MVVIALIGIIATATTASLGGLFGARLSASANKLSGMVRYAYNLASLTGKVHRVVIDMEKGSYHVEVLEERKECTAPTLEDEDDKKDDEEDDTPKGSKVSDSRINTEGLPHGIEFTGVFAKHNESVVEGGTESIYFFPDGTAEKAFIWLSDDEEVFTVEVTALKGTGIVHSEELDSQELKKR